MSANEKTYMLQTCYKFRIQLANKEIVRIEKRDNWHQLKGEPSRAFRYQNKKEQITLLLQSFLSSEIKDSQQVRKLGEALFEAIFDDVLRQEFINFYQEAVHDKKQLLRIELDIDEQTMPEIAALPWEFMCLPDSANSGHRWLATDPNIILSRRRSLWHPAPPIELEKGEKLRIALAIAAPQDLGAVKYEQVYEALESLAQEQAEKIELLPIVNPATPIAIDKLLEQKPHIFHFIGHGRMHNEARKEVGQIALVKKVFKKQKPLWFDAIDFSELFNRWSPGIVFLQACESGVLSASRAFSGVASKIVQMNIPVVVAMQYEVSNITATQFACEFYERLSKGEPVDVATQNGRRVIGLETQYSKRDFATPVIFMRVEYGYLFKREEEEKVGKKIVLQNHQNSDTSYLLSPTNSESIVVKKDLKYPLTPAIKKFDFEVVTIDVYGREKRNYKQAEYFREMLSDTVSMEMVSIPAGIFTMGSPREEEMSQEDERPQRIVSLKAFFIGKYPITQAQWRAIANLPKIKHYLESEPSYFKGDKLPVERVSWYHAQEFCHRLSHKTGRKYRLPTEAEWEYACRAKTLTPFHCGSEITAHLGNYNSGDDYYHQKTTKVGIFPANAFGLYDMHGLVWEWCEDYEHEDYSGAPFDGSAWLNDGNEDYRVLRGGSWDSFPNFCRSASRFSRNPRVPKKEFGFRVVFSEI